MSSTTTASSALQPCGFSRETLMELLKKHNKTDLYNHFFFKATTKEVIPEIYEKHENTMLTHPDLDRCMKCGRTIAEHPSTDIDNPLLQQKLCGFTRQVLIDLKKAIKKEELNFDDFFFKAEEGIPKRFRRHEETMLEYDDLDCCKKCGCTIDEHPMSPTGIPLAEHLPTTAASSGLKPCDRTRDQLVNLLEKHYKTDLFSRYFFVPSEAIPDRLKKHEDIICLNGDLDCCRECGCTIAEHPEVKPAKCPHGIPDGCHPNHSAAYFKKHLHESGVFQQLHCNHGTLDSTSCSFNVPPHHGFSEEAHDRLLDHCWERGFTEMSTPVGERRYKCSEDCDVTHHYPRAGLLCLVDNPDLPTKFLWVVPQDPPFEWCEWKNCHLWDAPALYLGYVLRYFGEAPGGKHRTIQESIKHHVQEARKSVSRQRSSVVSPTQRNTQTVTPFSASSRTTLTSQNASPSPVQLFVCQLGSERFGLNHFVKQEDEDEDNNLTVYTCNIVERGGVYCGEWTTGGDLPFLFNRTGNSSYFDGTESSSECCTDGSRSDLGSIVVDGSPADDHHCACEEDEDDEARTLGAPSSEFVADESTPTTADHVESIILGQLHEAKHAAATEPLSAVSVWVLEDHNRHLNGMLHRLPVAELRKLCREYSVGRGRSRVSKEFHVRGRIEKALDDELQQLLLETVYCVS